MTFAGQVLSGSTFAYGPTYFFVQAGISVDNAYQIAVGGTAVAFVGTVISWFLLSRFGRRTLYLNGMIVLTCLLLIVGILASTSQTGGTKWAQAAREYTEEEACCQSPVLTLSPADFSLLDLALRLFYYGRTDLLRYH